MPTDIFASERALTPIPIADGSVQFCRSFYDHRAADELFATLLSETPWREEAVTVWGRRHVQPRLIAWFGDLDARYKYSGLVVDPLAWTPLLQTIRREVQAGCHAQFNSVLLNQYRNERDRMGWHSDDEPELGRNPTIASLSFGEERVFKFRHKEGRHKDLAIRLPHGSLVLMSGELQHFWKHSIERETRPKGPRINLTFRLVRTPSQAEVSAAAVVDQEQGKQR
jgi:alkylated DNA repair dioxygenase AlkB